MPPSTVGMAFTTTQTLDSILLNNLLFRNTANAPISSFYTIYANGNGQTFWATSVQPENLSSFSSVIFPQFSIFSTNLSLLNSSYTTLSTQTVPSSFSSLTQQLTSTSAQFTLNYNILNNRFVTLSNNLNVNFPILSNTLTTNVNLTTSTTIGVVSSTISGISSIANYNSSFAGLLNLFQSGASTLSTAIFLESQATISALSTYISSVAASTLLSSYAYTSTQFNLLSSNTVTSTLIVELSTNQSLALLGYTSTFASTISTGFRFLSSQVYILNSSVFSTQSWTTSTLSGLSTQVSSLLGISSQISTIVYSQISSYVNPYFITQDIKFSQYTSTIQNQISSISSIASTNRYQILFISSYTNQSVSTISSINNTILRQLSTLTREFSVLTTSSILVGIYDSFYDLSTYTSLLIQSTINTIVPFKSTLFHSTVVQNMSSGLGYYNQFVSSIYVSTISTMIPIASTYISSLIFNLYSTGSFALLSSIDSTVFGKSNEFQSTNSSLTQIIVLSSHAQFASSIASYLLTPAGVQLSTFSTLSAAVISTFQGQGISTLRSQSALFGSYYTTNTSTQSTQTGIGFGLLSTLSTSFIQYSSTFTGLTPFIQTSSIRQFATQNTQFISAMTSYQGQFNTVLTSTNTGIFTNTTSSATRRLNSITSSTNTLYTSFANNLIAAASSFSISTLFTNQTIRLTSTNFVGTLDFAGFTNFTINVQAPLISGSSNYRIAYNSNQIRNLNYRRGYITIDVSTVTSGYSNNNGRLCLDTYRWGLPTTIYNEFYPSISSSDYTSLYSYTILNNIVYTNLINIFPRLRISAFTITTGTNTNVSGSYWRGTPVAVSWSNYSFFPIGAIGAPPFNADVNIDIFYSNNLIVRNGPYPINVSSAIVNLPYLTGPIVNPAPIQLRTYIVGRPLESFSTNINIIMPQLYSITLQSPFGKFLAVNEVGAFSDAGTNTLTGLSRIYSYDGTGSSNAYFRVVSQSFDGSSRIEVDANTDFSLGTGDFTIEWFQYMTGGSSAGIRPIFTTVAGTTNGIQFAWTGTTATNNISLTLDTPIYVWSAIGSSVMNSWNHIAITRQGTNLRLFINGVANTTVYTSSDSIPNTLNLVLGRTALSQFYVGNITNFHWVKGTALYTSNFTVPFTAITSVSDTKLLLSAVGDTPLDTSRTGKNVIRYGVTSIIASPFITGYAKERAIDGNSTTNFISANYQDTLGILNQLTMEPILGPSLTSISSITVRNISSVSSFLRSNFSTFTDEQELNGATLRFTSLIGAIFYESTITLTSSALQSFSL